MWRLILPLAILGVLTACTPLPSVEQNQEPFIPPTQEEQGEDVTASSAVVSAGTGALPERLLATGLLEVGTPAAPHTLLLFVTPGSSYSQVYASDFVLRLLDAQVRQGQLKIHVAFVPFRKYPQTESATAALICATKQGKGWRAIPVLMENPVAFTVGGPSLSSAFDLQQMSTCMAEQQTRDMLLQHAGIASSLSVTLVPTAFFDGAKEVGLPQWADLRAQVEALVKR